MTWREWAAVLGAALGAFMAILDIQITNASLREIQGSIGLDLSEGGWISTAYLIAEIVVIPMTGFLSEIFGIRLYLIWNAALFIVASILCGLAWNLPSIIAFRVFQGFVGGTLIPMSFQIMLLFMPKDKKPIGMALFGLTATLAPTLGPSLGGFLTDHYGWRLNFFINIVPGILLILAVRYGIPREKLDLERLKKMDVLGVISLVFGLGSLTYVLEEGAKVQWFEDREIQVGTLVALGALSVFLVDQLLRKDPLLKLKLLANRNFAIATLITSLSAVALYGGIYSLSIYLGQLHGYTATEIGSVMMWVGIPQLLIMPMMPALMKRVDLRILAGLGMLLFSLSNYLNSHLDFGYSGEQFRFSLFIRAIGQPLFLIPLSTIGVALVSPEESGDASSLFNMARNLGGSVGIALAGTFLVSRQAMHFDHMIERVLASDTRTGQALKMMELGLRQKGLDPVAAQMGSNKILVGLAQRDSFVQAFGDIFTILGFGTLLCVVLIFLLKGVENAGHDFEMVE